MQTTAPELVYERLAERLAQTPNGFPRTRSGVELKLLARMFTPEQAALACVMHLKLESIEDIAAHAGFDVQNARAVLKAMLHRGLVRVGRGGAGLAFALLPFIVGSYEEALPYLDQEMAQLFEAMVQESSGVGMLSYTPSIQRVLPVEESIHADIEVQPYEKVSAVLSGARAFGLRECICRKQKALIGQGCEHERMNCISFAPVEGAFANLPHVQPIPREDALRILKESEEAGLVHCVYNQQEEIYYICNCCTCCCGIMRGLIEFGQHHALARSDFLCSVEAEACTSCEACVERCHFGALSVLQDVCVVDPQRCMGCGLCVSVCPSDAMRLRRREAPEHAVPPRGLGDWMTERAQTRGEPLEKML